MLKKWLSSERSGGQSWGVKVWRRFLGFTVAYGYKPGQALWLFMALLLVGYTLLNRQPSGP
jgi:hypothetical protein